LDTIKSLEYLEQDLIRERQIAQAKYDFLQEIKSRFNLLRMKIEEAEEKVKE